MPPASFSIRIVELAARLVGRLCFGTCIDNLPFNFGSGKAQRPKYFIVNLAFLRYDPVVSRDAFAFSIRVGDIGDHNHPRSLTCHRPWRGFAVQNGKRGRCRKICWGKSRPVSAACWESITEYLPPSRVRRSLLANQGECRVNCPNERLEVFSPVSASKIVCGQRGVNHLWLDPVGKKAIIRFRYILH